MQSSATITQSNMIWYGIEYLTVVIETEYKSEFEPTQYSPYLALMGELWDVFCKDFGENWLCYNSTTLRLENGTLDQLIQKMQTLVVNCIMAQCIMAPNLRPLYDFLTESSYKWMNGWTDTGTDNSHQRRWQLRVKLEIITFKAECPVFLQYGNISVSISWQYLVTASKYVLSYLAFMLPQDWMLKQIHMDWILRSSWIYQGCISYTESHSALTDVLLHRF